MRLSDLETLDVEALDALYTEASLSQRAAPKGAFRGTLLGELPLPSGQSPLLRPLLRLGFGRTPFGIDFDAQRWFFFQPALLVGRFRAVCEPSRWRQTDTIALHYEQSRLPTMLRSQLYDELKPLNDDLCLGIGGLNAPRGQGEQFLFALVRIR